MGLHLYRCENDQQVSPTETFEIKEIDSFLPCGTKFLREFIFADWRFFCVLRELVFAIRTDWFFLLRINFHVFQEAPVPSIDNIFVFIEYVQ